MAYPPLVRQDGFQLPSPAHTASPKSNHDDDRDDQLFMPHNISFIPDSFRKFPPQTHTHHPTHPQHPIDFADELATLIETPHVSSHERSTHSGSPNDDAYRHNLFDISAPTPPQHQPQHQQHHHDIYQHDYAHFNPSIPPALNSSIRYEPHPDPTAGFQYRHSSSPAHRSRSRSRPSSLGPTRSACRDRRANSISSHVSTPSSPPRPHPHAIVIPGRGNTMGGFFVPNDTSAPPDYSLPTPDSLSHSFGLQQPHTHSQHSQYAYPAQTSSSPYYTYQSVNRAGTPNMGISPTDVETLNGISINDIAAHHVASSLPASHVGAPPKRSTSTSSTKQPDPETHLSEKRRRRRESHNAVERRRRDNINERIGELAGLIPGVLFECDGPLVMPGSTPSAGTAPGPTVTEDLFTIGIGETGMHVLPAEEGLADLPEEDSMVKKDPSEDGEGLVSPTSPSTSAVNGTTSLTASEQTTIKANKGMILRKSVEYIRYLQQLVSIQASRGRDLEERNRKLERELAVLRGDIGPSSSASSTSSSSPSVVSSAALFASSSSTSMPSVSDSTVDRCGEDLEMADGSMESGIRSREGDGLRGRRLGRKMQAHMLEGMEI